MHSCCQLTAGWSGQESYSLLFISSLTPVTVTRCTSQTVQFSLLCLYWYSSDISAYVMLLMLLFEMRMVMMMMMVRRFVERVLNSPQTQEWCSDGVGWAIQRSIQSVNICSNYYLAPTLSSPRGMQSTVMIMSVCPLASQKPHGRTSLCVFWLWWNYGTLSTCSFMDNIFSHNGPCGASWIPIRGESIL